MCRLLVVNRSSKDLLEDQVRMYLNLLDLPVELESSCSYPKSPSPDYDIVLTDLPHCVAGLPLPCTQSQMKRVLLSDHAYPLPDNYYLYPRTMSIRTFYDMFCQLSPDTVSRAPGSRPTARWFANHDPLLNRILQVLQIIREEYAQDLSLNYLAQRVYSSPCYLSTLFTAYMGISPMAYVNDYRMKISVDLLLNTDIKVTDICQMVGHRSLPYFCTCFKNKYHMTPTQFREQYAIHHAS